MPLTGRPKLTKFEAGQAKGRLLQYVDIMRMSQAQFCITAGLDRRYINTFSGSPTPSTVRAIEETYPALNMDWVLYGVGEMIKPDHKDNPKEIVSHPKADTSVTIANGSGASLTQTGNNNNIDIDLGGKKEPMSLDAITDDHNMLHILNRLILEKDQLISEKDKFIQKLLDRIDKLSAPCK